MLGEIKDISATLANVRLEIEVLGKEGKVKKTAHDHISVTGQLVNGIDVRGCVGWRARAGGG